MGAELSQQQSGESTIKVPRSAIRQYINEREMLKSELVVKAEEIQFLRKRIINDFTEHISLLEEELKKEKSKLSEKKQVIDKYASLCRRLDDKVRRKEKQNEAVLRENTDLLMEIFELKRNMKSEDEEEEEAAGTSKASEELDLLSKYGYNNRALFELLVVYEDLEELKSKMDVVKRKLFEEKPAARGTAGEIRFSRQISAYDKCKEKLHNQGIVVTETNPYRIEEIRRRLDRRSDNTNEIRVDLLGQLHQVEAGLQNISEELTNDIGKVSRDVKPFLAELRKILDEDFVGLDSMDGHARMSDSYSGGHRMEDDRDKGDNNGNVDNLSKSESWIDDGDNYFDYRNPVENVGKKSSFHSLEESDA